MFHPLADPQRHDNRALAIETPFITDPRCTKESPNTQRNDNRAVAIGTPVIHEGHSFRQFSVHKALSTGDINILRPARSAARVFLKTGRGAQCTRTTLGVTSSLSRYWVMLVLAMVTTQRQGNQDGRNTAPPDEIERTTTLPRVARTVKLEGAPSLSELRSHTQTTSGIDPRMEQRELLLRIDHQILAARSCEVYTQVDRLPHCLARTLELDTHQKIRAEQSLA